MIKNYFQNLHYSKNPINPFVYGVLRVAEIFYSKVVCFKNFLYEKNILKEKQVDIEVICVGNLTTGGVGKTPIVEYLADEYSKIRRVAVISRGYGSKLQNRVPNIIKNKIIFYKDGSLCGDEVYQLAQKTPENVVIITCKNRYLAAKKAKELGCNLVILDDGFQNRKLKKDKSIILIDSKLKFGNGHLLPLGPLREPVSEIKRASEIILVNKGDENISEAEKWLRGNFDLPYMVSDMTISRIYNLKTKEETEKRIPAIAFCAIGNSEKFFDFARSIFDIKDTVSFCDHHKYTKNDINKLTAKAKQLNLNAFIITQKDETKLKYLVCDIDDFEFYVMELKTKIS